MSQAVALQPPRRTAGQALPFPQALRHVPAREVHPGVPPRAKRSGFEDFSQGYIDALIAGRAEEQRHFTEYFGELLHVKVRSRVRSAQLRDDIVQETFLRTISFLQRGQLDHPERLGAFVCRVCDNIAKEQFRKMGREFVSMEGQSDPPDERIDSEGRLVNEQRKESVRRVLAEMPEKDRLLLRAIFIEGRDKDEVCREMRVDRNYLRVLLHRAKAKFRESLRKGSAGLLAALFA